MRVKVSGFLTYWGFSEKNERYHAAATRPGEKCIYDAEIKQSEDEAIWRVLPEWTEYVGEGSCQLNW